MGNILERGKSSTWACWDYLAKPKNVAVTRVLSQRREKTSSERATPTQRNFALPPSRCNLIFSVSMIVWFWVLGFGYPAFPCCHLSVGTFVTTYGQQASAHLGLKTWDLIVSWLARASSPCLPAHLLPGWSLVQFFLFLVHRAIQCWEFIWFLPEDLMKILDIWKYISLNKL